MGNMTGAAVQTAVGGVQMAMGVGKKIGAAAARKKAERQEDSARTLLENDARRQAADAANPMGNSAAQATIGSMKRDLAAQGDQQAAQAAIGGATPEMALAQQKQRSQAISDTYTALAQQASANYNNALSGMANVQAESIQNKADRGFNRANQLSASADADINAGLQNTVQGAAGLGGK